LFVSPFIVYRLQATAGKSTRAHGRWWYGG
jgi:hypothetical protein